MAERQPLSDYGRAAVEWRRNRYQQQAIESANNRQANVAAAQQRGGLTSRQFDSIQNQHNGDIRAGLIADGQRRMHDANNVSSNHSLVPQFRSREMGGVDYKVDQRLQGQSSELNYDAADRIAEIRRRQAEANQLGVQSTQLEGAQSGILMQQNLARSALAPRINADASMVSAKGEAFFNTGRGNLANAQAGEQVAATRNFTDEQRKQQNNYGNEMLGQQVASQRVGNKQAGKNLVTPQGFTPMPQPQQPPQRDPLQDRLTEAQINELNARAARDPAFAEKLKWAGGVMEDQLASPELKAQAKAIFDSAMGGGGGGASGGAGGGEKTGIDRATGRPIAMRNGQVVYTDTGEPVPPASGS